MEKKMTGYASIDKPWLKYYSEEAINAPLPECTMYQYVWENNKNHLSDIALRYFGSKVTYSEFFEKVQTVACAFYSRGIRKGDIVTIVSMHTPETLYAIYALNYIGAISNLVHMTLTEEEILTNMNNTTPKMLIVLDVAIERVFPIISNRNIPIVVLEVANSMPFYIKIGYRLNSKPVKHNCITFNDLLRTKSTALPMSTDSASTAVIVYSSGTTGEPKGVLLSNRALNAHSFQIKNANFGFVRQKLFLNILPPFIGFGISHIHLALNAGVECSLWIDSKPDAIAKEFFRLKPHFFVTGPAFVDAIIKHPPVKLSKLTLFAGGGGALPDATEQALNDFFKRCGSNVIYTNGYGLTETSSTLCASTNSVHRSGSIGIPLPRTNVKVKSLEDGSELPYGEVGELCFCTPNLMTGYYQNPSATDEIISCINGELWIRTGDLGRVDKDGFVYITGRIKRIYITRDCGGAAYKLFPQKIENILCKHPHVNNCGVVAVNDKERINVAIAYVSSDGIRSVDDLKSELWQLAISNLSPYERPVSIHVLSQLPLMQNGKIDYRALEREAQTMNTP